MAQKLTILNFTIYNFIKVVIYKEARLFNEGYNSGDNRWIKFSL